MWRPQNGKLPAVYLNQPYDWTAEDAEATAALCADRGLEWTDDPHAAWHYPGHVRGVVIWNPARYAYVPSQPPPLPLPGPDLVRRRAARERSQRRKGRQAYDSLCQRLDALFYPTEADRERLERAWCDPSGAPQPEPGDPLSEEDLAAIGERCRKATPAPWHWTQDVVNDYLRSRGRGSYREQYLYILQGRGHRYQDSWDANIMRLQWSQIKGNTFCGFARDEDAAFIAAARTDVPRLLAEVRRLRAALAEREQEP
jgi:hypothetical protein